jgi:hypothetical protein
MSDERRFAVGDKVRKVTGDYSFDSTVVSVYNKLSGQVRLVCEDDRGVNFIFNQNQLEKVSEPSDPSFLVNEALQLIKHSLTALQPPAGVDGIASARVTIETARALLETASKEMSDG